MLAAGRSRVRPILMTSATTLLGVMPLALDFGGDYEVWPPFAITVLGGLAVSMVSTLIFVPVAYMGLDQVRAWLRGIGRIGVGLATGGATATVGAVYAESASLFWTALLALPSWVLLLGLIALVLRVHRTRAARRETPAVHSIRLQTLTKIYGAPKRFRREWIRFDRRDQRLRAQGIDPVDRKGHQRRLELEAAAVGAPRLSARVLRGRALALPTLAGDVGASGPHAAARGFAWSGPRGGRAGGAGRCRC